MANLIFYLKNSDNDTKTWSAILRKLGTIYCKDLGPRENTPYIQWLEDKSYIQWLEDKWTIQVRFVGNYISTYDIREIEVTEEYYTALLLLCY